MPFVVAFAATLVAAVLLSALARRSILSTAVLFLGVGLLVNVLGLVDVSARAPVTSEIVRVTLFAVLYTDALRVPLGDLTSTYRLHGRALLIALPLTVAGAAALGHWLSGLPWLAALLLGAVLAPTDPVLSSAIIGREAVPARLRRLLNVESGINDGLALPMVLLLLAAIGGRQRSFGTLVTEIVVGVAIGIAIPWVVVQLLRVPKLSPVGSYEPLTGLAIAVLVFAVAEVVHANLFLAAFAAGATLATVGHEVRGAFEELGETLSELLKVLALLLFGALVPIDVLSEQGWRAYVFALLVLFAVRPASIGVAMIGSRLDRWERLAAAWFGPRGFASVVYALLVLRSNVPHSGTIFTLVALVIAASILAHSSTDVVVARLFRRREDHDRGIVRDHQPA